VVASDYEGVEVSDRRDALWKAILENVWDERELVESILTLTPAELDAALNDD